MKLDPQMLRFMTKDQMRVLTAVEMGMKNHHLVPIPLIESIAALNRGGAYKLVQTLLKHKLIAHEGGKNDGYKLTYLGYDFLALRAFSQKGVIKAVGRQIGVGKESDIFLVENEEGEHLCLKLHRLGRVSFRSIKNKRDYLEKRKNANWLYLSRIAAMKEFAYMKVLHDHGFPTPVPIEQNRHCVLMSLVKGYPMCQVREVRHPPRVYDNLMELICKFARHGLIHCDFNEFNLMLGDEEEITVIDFPQMISTSHMNADYYFDRDVQCIRTWFEKRYHFVGEAWPVLSKVGSRLEELDKEVSASGFSAAMDAEIQEAHQASEAMGDEAGENPDWDEDDRFSYDGEEDEEEAERPRTRSRTASEAAEELSELQVETGSSSKAPRTADAGDEDESDEGSGSDDEDEEADSDEEEGEEEEVNKKERGPKEKKAKTPAGEGARHRGGRGGKKEPREWDPRMVKYGKGGGRGGKGGNKAQYRTKSGRKDRDSIKFAGDSNW